jgi:tol-pal system protein YbgF
LKPTRKPLSAGVCLLIFSLCGCWVKEEVGKQMQADIAAMQVEMDVIKKAHADQKKSLQERIQEADKRIAELVQIIEEYRRATGRNAADVGVDIERIKSQIMEMRGKLEVNEHRLGIIEKKLSIMHKDLNDKRDEAVKRQEEEAKKKDEEAKKRAEEEASKDPLAAITRPEKQKDFYKLAFNLLDSGQVQASRLLFEEFLKKWPSGEYSDNALYWIAETYYHEKQYRVAALKFQKVRQDFPRSDKAGDALLKLGFCFYSMERYKEALPFLQDFIQSYPKSRLASKAKKRVKQIKKFLKTSGKKRKKSK